MTATKDDITKYTKPELIKALRAALAREARLAKKIEALQSAVDLLKARPVVAATSTYDSEGVDDVHDDGESYELETINPDGTIGDPPRFPWEQK